MCRQRDGSSAILYNHIGTATKKIVSADKHPKMHGGVYNLSRATNNQILICDYQKSWILVRLRACLKRFGKGSHTLQSFLPIQVLPPFFKNDVDANYLRLVGTT